MHKSVPVFEREVQRISVPEWIKNINDLQKKSREQRCNSYALRKSSNELRNESSITTRWDTYTNNQLLRDRISEVEIWRDQQTYAYNKLRDELTVLTEEKFSTERLLEALQVPTIIVGDCLSKRDQRVSNELTRDQLDVELKNELTLLESYKRILTDLCHTAWDKMNEIQSMLRDLEYQLEDKDKALDIETNVRGLCYQSAKLSFKPNASNIPFGSRSEEAYTYWNNTSIQAAETLINESKTVRENLVKARETSKNDTYLQCQKVEYILRKRVYDIESARNEIEWQKKQTEFTLEELSREIDTLQSALSDKINPQKLVETRLEERKKRPQLELVSDRVQEGLLEEWGRVKTSRELLEAKLNQALMEYNSMVHQLERIDKDLANKNQALDTDGSLVEFRKPLNRGHDCETDRRVRLLKAREV